MIAAGRRKEKLLELKNKISCDIIEIDIREQDKIYSEFRKLEIEVLIIEKLDEEIKIKLPF